MKRTPNWQELQRENRKLRREARRFARALHGIPAAGFLETDEEFIRVRSRARKFLGIKEWSW